MKIALDVSRMHKLSETRGIGFYSQNLFNAVKKYTDADIELIENKTDYSKFDLVHFPFFDLFKHTLPLNLSKPYVVTIPDLIPIQYPKHYPPGIKGRINIWFQKLAIKKARAVIAISETVRNDIIQILKIDPKKVFSIYLAPDEHFRKISDETLLNKVKNKYGLPDEFVLYVGNVNWNKNILNTAQACLEANKNLVVIGNSFLDKTNLHHAEKKSHKIFLEKYSENKLVQLLGYVENEELVAIMNMAASLIFVSFYEGFGLPILEAQACGLPVITSNISATAEIADSGAILVDPKNVGEISEAVNNIFNSQTLRRKLIKLGHENVKKYSWEKTALETVKVYENVLA